MKLRLLLFVSFLAVAGLVGNASAADYVWDDGGVGDNVATADNWDPCGNPTGVDNIKLDDAALSTAVISADFNTYNATIGSVNALGAKGVKLTAGTWALDNSGSITIGAAAGSSGTLTVEGGTIDHPWNFAVGAAGNGTLTMTGGMIKNPAGIWMGGYLTNGVGYGTLNLLGGTIEQPLYWGGVGIDADGEMNVDGGLYNAYDIGPGYDTGIILGNNHWTWGYGHFAGGAPAKGTLNVDSGTVNALFIAVGQDPQTEGYINMTGGEINLGWLGLGIAMKNNSKGRVNVDGGTIYVEADITIGAAGTLPVYNAYINITGGVIEINDPNGSKAADMNEMITDGYLAGYGQCDTDHVIISYDMMNQLTTITAVPEPSTIALLGLGSAVFFRRRKRS